MFSQNCKINNSLFEVQWTCSFFSPVCAPLQHKQNFLSRPSSSQPSLLDFQHQRIKPNLKKRNKRSLKTVKQDNLPVDSIFEKVRPDKDKLYHSTLETEQTQIINSKMIKSVDLLGSSPFVSPLQSTTFHSDLENCPEMNFRRYNFQKKIIEEKERPSSSPQKNHYFEHIFNEQSELPLESNLIQNTIERRLD